MNDELIEHMNECRSTTAVAPKDFKSVWGYKYVRFADGTVLFCEAGNLYASHKNLSKEYTKAPPVFAGEIKVRGKRWCITGSGSTTLGVRRGDSDERYIQKALGDKYLHDQEVQY